MANEVTRRRFFSIGGIAAAIAAVPTAALAVEQQKKSDVIEPVFLERECDWGQSEMSAEAWREYCDQREAMGLPRDPACHRRFKWHLGASCMCPGCLRIYCVSSDEIRSGKFRPVSGQS